MIVKFRDFFEYSCTCFPFRALLLVVFPNPPVQHGSDHLGVLVAANMYAGFPSTQLLRNRPATCARHATAQGIEALLSIIELPSVAEQKDTTTQSCINHAVPPDVEYI